MLTVKSRERPKSKDDSVLDGTKPKVKTEGRIQANPLWHQLAIRVQANLANGRSNETLADWLPQARGTAAERAVVHSASPLADHFGANAVTLGQVVHLSADLSHRGTAEQRRVLAHEAVHVAQRLVPGPAAPKPALETEARQLTSRVLAGYAIQPRFHAGAAMALADKRGQTPKDKLDVARAKKRREVLQRYKDILEGKRADVAAERQDMRERRRRLDESMAENLKKSEKYTRMKSRDVNEYPEQERKNLAGLNKKPLTLEVTMTTVRIRARFQVRFEGLTDQQAAAQFPTLEQNLQKGVRDTWNQTLSGAVFGGRMFEVIPELTLIPTKAARDKNFWLITVRPTDKGPLAYEGKPLGTAPGGDPTSVADPLLDGGVMSIPPSHIKKPNILGHETLHLFGLVDRYVPIANLGEFGLRDTKGRQDPLGADEGTGDVKGKILEEDLGFVLEEFGVYHQEEISAPLSTEGMSYSEVQAELTRTDEIISKGWDPYSIIRERKDFTPEMIKQAEDLE